MAERDRDPTPARNLEPTGEGGQSEQASSVVPTPRSFVLPVGYVQYYFGAGAAAGSERNRPAAVQRKADLSSALDDESAHQVAADGVRGGGGALPFAAQIQSSFGAHDVGSIRAHVGGQAQQASAALGARAYATGSDVAFGSQPDLHTAAHEAAHVVQQRAGVQLKGGIGEAGDAYERHADAVADRVVAGGSAEQLLDQMAPGGGGRAGSAVQGLQLTLNSDVTAAIGANPVDGQHVLDLIAAAPLAEVTAMSTNTALIGRVEARMPSAMHDHVRARLARRLFIDGHQPIQAWRLITGDDRLRRQRYLDAYGTTEEQRAFEDGVIADGTNTGYMIRAFDSYWDIEASRQAGARWNATVIQRMHAQLKLLPDQDVRAMDTNGRVWRTLVLSVDPALIDRAAFGSGEFTVGAHADVTSTQTMGYGTRLSADAAVGDTTIQVTEGNRFHTGDTFAMGTGSVTLSVDTNYDRGTVQGISGNTLTIDPPLAHVHHKDDLVTKVDANAGGARLSAAAALGATTITVSEGKNFSVNDGFAMGTGQTTAATDPNYDHGTVTAIAGNTLTISPALAHNHASGDLVGRTVTVGNNSALTAAAAVGATTLEVGAGSSFALNDQVSLGTGATTNASDPNFDMAFITAIAGNTLTLKTALRHAHAIGDVVMRVDARGSGARAVNWLNATVRHEIAHAVDASIPSVVKGFTESAGIGGWWAGSEPASEGDFDTWAGAMGGASAWTGAVSGAAPTTTPITAADKALVRTAITNAVAGGQGSLFSLGLAATHPVMVNRANNVPVIVAAEACLSRGDNFFATPEALYAASGKVFSTSRWYRKFQYSNESVRTERVSEYSLYAAAEFFAETYTVFYEEAGRPGVTEADYGRLIGNSTWREWMRSNIHNRGLAPAGTTPAPAPGTTPAGGGGGAAPSGGGGDGKQAGGAQPGSGTGKAAHRSGP